MLVRDLRVGPRAHSLRWMAFVAMLVSTVPRAPVVAQEVTAAKQRTHTVKRGDTLWDLAKTYLGDAFQWPEIYRLNTDIIENPHWIYPGEVLKIPGEQTVVAETPAARVTPRAQAPGRTIFSPPGVTYEAAAQPATRAPSTPAVRLGEYLAAPWVDERGGPHTWGSILKTADLPGIAAAEERGRFQLYDRVLIAPPGKAPVRARDWFLVYRFGPFIDDLGQIIIPTGVVEVVRPGGPGEATVARIVKMFGAIEGNERLIPYDSTPASVVGTTVPVINGPSGSVKWIYNEPVLPTTQQYIVLDLARRQGLAIGDQIEFYRPRERHPEEGQLAEPEISIGRAQVVKVTPFGGTVVVTSVAQPKIEPGTAARLAAKIP